MKKRILAVVLGLCMVLSLGGCSKKEYALENDSIKIKKYKGLEVEKVDVLEVTDADVEESINMTIKQEGKTIAITDRAVQNGDEIILDYAGKLNGEAFQGGTASDQTLVIGSGQFIPGFEEAIIGHNVGETFDIDVTFPEDYGNEELNGQAVVFTITVDKIVGYPELTDALVAELQVEEKTAEEYRARVKSDLEASNKQAADSELEQKVWEELINNCVVDEYPQEKYNELSTQINNQYNYYAQMYGVTVDQLLQGIFGVSLDEMIKNRMMQEFAVSLIAKKEKLTVSDEYYTTKLAEYAAEYGYSSAEEMEESAGKENLQITMKQELVAQFLMENCIQVEEK